jgi:hypothetical protein
MGTPSATLAMNEMPKGGSLFCDLVIMLIWTVSFGDNPPRGPFSGLYLTIRIRSSHCYKNLEIHVVVIKRLRLVQSVL